MAEDKTKNTEGLDMTASPAMNAGDPLASKRKVYDISLRNEIYNMFSDEVEDGRLSQEEVDLLNSTLEYYKEDF